MILKGCQTMGNGTKAQAQDTRLPESDVEAIYMERTNDELESLAEEGFITSGNAFCRVLLVKGRPGPAETNGSDLLSGADGEALRAGLARLGWKESDWAGLATFLGQDGFPQADPADLAVAVEVFDPECVVALDSPAARNLALAWGLPEPLPAGKVERVFGRRVLAMGGFEAALASQDGKKEMWRRLRQLPPLPSPW